MDKSDLNNLKININKNIIKKDKVDSYDSILTSKDNNNPEEDDYSDCKSLKGIILNIKQRILENRFKLNKTFNEFDKQILQDQYLIERFYEMKKSFPNKSRINFFRNKLKKKHQKYNIKSKNIFKNNMIKMNKNNK